VLALALLVGYAQAQGKEQERVEHAGKVMQEILAAPDSIPIGVLDKAECVVVLPSVVKFALGIGGSYGRGVMTCRSGKNFRGPWGAPTMMALEGGSFGLQLGGQATDFVLLLMNSRAASSILTSKVKLGANASAAAGPVGGPLRPKLMLRCKPRYSLTPELADCLLGFLWQARLCAQTMARTKISMEKM